MKLLATLLCAAALVGCHRELPQTGFMLASHLSCQGHYGAKYTFYDFQRRTGVVTCGDDELFLISEKSE